MLAFILPTTFERLGMDLTNKFLGRAMIVDLNLFKNFGYGYCIIGMILGLVYFILKKKLKNINMNNQIILEDEESVINS